MVVGDALPCPLCGAAAAAVGVLCRACAVPLAAAASASRAPGIIRSRSSTGTGTGTGTGAPATTTAATTPAGAAAWLIDPWGQLHAVTGPRCRLGRDDDNDIVIADLMISSRHAELARIDDGAGTAGAAARFTVRDCGSANGTGIGDGPRVSEAFVEHGARLWLGDIAFYFWARPEAPVSRVPAPKIGTLVPAPAAFALTWPRRGLLEVRAAAGHAVARAPGALRYVGAGADGGVVAAPDEGMMRRTTLARLPFQFLRHLCEARVTSSSPSSPPPSDAAYVSTAALVAALPFNTPRPEANHVRQVAATLRAALVRAGVPGGGAAGDDGVVQATERLGYRVVWSVRRL